MTVRRTQVAGYKSGCSRYGQSWHIYCSVANVGHKNDGLHSTLYELMHILLDFHKIIATVYFLVQGVLL